MGTFVKIKTTAGQELSVIIDYPKGDPENPLSWDELIQKFNGLVGPVYSNEKMKKIVNQVLSLEKMDNLSNLSSLLLSG